jgi:hypothetical protein
MLNLNHHDTASAAASPTTATMSDTPVTATMSDTPVTVSSALPRPWDDAQVTDMGYGGTTERHAASRFSNSGEAANQHCPVERQAVPRRDDVGTRSC